MTELQGAHSVAWYGCDKETGGKVDKVRLSASIESAGRAYISPCSSRLYP
jgi:hypothetical protein